MTPPPTLSLSSPHDLSAFSTTYKIDEATLRSLHAAAVAAKSTSYSPYSHFRVGAALLTTDGSIVKGANVENASYPVTTCAERVALTKAVTEGHFDVSGGKLFRAIAVATDISPPASPCGMCRQCIREFCDLEMPIIMFDKDDNFCVMRLRELLPLSFGPEALGVPGVQSVAGK